MNERHLVQVDLWLRRCTSGAGGGGASTFPADALKLENGGSDVERRTCLIEWASQVRAAAENCNTAVAVGAD
jgi:hypothetical protein